MATMSVVMPVATTRKTMGGKKWPVWETGGWRWVPMHATCVGGLVQRRGRGCQVVWAGQGGSCGDVTWICVRCIVGHCGVGRGLLSHPTCQPSPNCLSLERTSKHHKWLIVQYTFNLFSMYCHSIKPNNLLCQHMLNAPELLVEIKGAEQWHQTGCWELSSLGSRLCIMSLSQKGMYPILWNRCQKTCQIFVLRQIKEIFDSYCKKTNMRHM